MKREDVEKELSQLALAPPRPDRLPPPGGEGGTAADLLLSLESLALTLDDARLRSLALSSLALTRAERGEKERALELAHMTKRTGEERVEVAALLGADAGKRFESFATELAKDGTRLDLLRDVPAWIRALAHGGVPVTLDFLESLDERLRGVVLLECAPSLRGTSAETKARDLARALLASETGFAVAFGVEALVALNAFTPEDAAAARPRLVNASLDAGSLDALASVARHVALGAPDTGDLRADAVARIALARRAGEEGDLVLGREHLARATHAVVELRVKHRNVDAVRVLAAALPLVPVFHLPGTGLIESLVEDPILMWAPTSARDVLGALALATPRIVAEPAVVGRVLEDTARLALRRIKAADNARPRVMFTGLGAVARAAPVGATSTLDRIAAGAREAILAPKGMFGSGKPFFEYLALLGVGEARARSGDLTAIEGAIDALEGPRGELVPHLLDDALESAFELESSPLALRVLDVARQRLDEVPVARWLARVAARVQVLAGPRAAARRKARQDESRERGRLLGMLK